MNFVAGKMFIRLTTKIPIKRYIHKENVNMLSYSNVNLLIKRTRLALPKLYEIDRKVQKRDGRRIGVYGYFLLIFPIGTFLLGTWQVQRRKWKVNLIENMKKQMSQEPIDLPENLEELETKEYCPVKVRGTFLHEREFTLGPRSLLVGGKAPGERGMSLGSRPLSGYHVITPFKVENRDLTILVNRGWVPLNRKNPETRQSGQIEGVVDIIGAVRLNEKRPPFVPRNYPENGIWYYRDINAMAEMTGASPVYIELSSKSSVPHGPISGQTKVSVRNEHLTYIITWYGLSLFTGYSWYRMFIQKLPLF